MLLYVIFVFIPVLLVTVTTLRLLFILPQYRPLPAPRRRGTPTHLMVILGSGGHTAEMFAILKDLDPRSYTHRSYIISSGDSFSAGKAREFEETLAEETRKPKLGPVPPPVEGNESTDGGNKKQGDEVEKEVKVGTYDIFSVPRARRIHQSLLSTPLTALHSLVCCLVLLRRGPIMTPSPSSLDQNSEPASSSSTNTSKSKSKPVPKTKTARSSYPDMILTNGPGTAVIVILASLILRFFNIAKANSNGKMRTIYVESWARVRRLSLSGRLLVRVVDRFLVQWEGLKDVGGGRGEFLGVLV